jgi:hypothetical protein
MTSEKRPKPTEADIDFMRSIEAEFKATSGLTDRSQFKIFYSPVWRAKIMVLGINPAGTPSTITPDGVRYLNGSRNKASSSANYYDGGENDLVDCVWRENTGLLKLLMPILQSHDCIRRNVVKTNLGFSRSENTNNKAFIKTAKKEATPFLRRILDRVAPELILLAGVRLPDFTERHCAKVVEIEERIEEQSVHQTVIWPACVRLLGGHSCIAVEVAHASQFSWIYETHDVASQIIGLMNNWQKQGSVA